MAGGLALMQGAAVGAATFDVTTTADFGAGSLRQAMADANAAPGRDTVRFSTALSGQTIALNGVIAISDDVDIVGPFGGRTILDGGWNGVNDSTVGDRIFAFDLLAAPDVSIASLVLQNGNGGDRDGGGADVDILSNGGAIIIPDGRITLSDTVFRSNTSNDGGAIKLYAGSITATDSAFHDNVARDDGGAIDMDAVGSFTNVTFHRNKAGAPGATGGSARGGAFRNDGDLTLTHVTLYANTGQEGGAFENRGTLRVSNTLMVGNDETASGTVQEFAPGGTVIDLGGNWQSDTGRQVVANNVSPTALAAGAFGPVSGSTPVVTLGADSAVRGVIAAAGAVGVDQRGAARTTEVEPGAYELPLPDRDHSDAPPSYGATRHDIGGGLRLGTAVTAETSAVQGADDASDDGAVFPVLTPGSAVTIPVSVTQDAAGDGSLQAWIDWNGDGVFGTGERIASDVPGTAAGTATIALSVTPPATAAIGTTTARLRWSSVAGLDAIAFAPDGEVEDYTVTIQAAVPSNVTATVAPGEGTAAGPCTTKAVRRIDAAAYATATGSGPGGVPSLSYTVPDGYRRMMFAVLAVERDHSPLTIRGDNYASGMPRTGSFADAPTLFYGGTQMSVYTYAYAMSGGDPNDAATGEISHELYFYYLRGGEAPTGANQITVGSGFDLPQNAGDEAVVMAITLSNVLTLQYLGSGSDRTAPYSATIAADPVATGGIQPLETAAADNLLLSWGVAGDASALSFGPGWIENAKIRVENANGTYAADPGRSSGPYGENDGMGTYIQSIGGVSGLETVRVDLASPGTFDLVGLAARIVAGGCDAGDAPASYGFAHHDQHPFRYLGTVAGDADLVTAASAASALADGDDADGIVDDDGIAGFPVLTGGDTAYAIPASQVTVTASGGSVYAWIDFDGDGAFGPDEFASAPVSGATIGTPLTFAPASPVAATGATFARFRLSTLPLTAADFAGDGGFGEVEDYRIAVGLPPEDRSDGPADGAPAPDGLSLAAYGTATHGIVPGIQLGATVTGEASAAEGADDASDDGVVFPALVPGEAATVPISVTGGGYLSAWIDFDGSGTFDDPVERIAADAVDADGDGTILLSVAVPDWAMTGRTHARFRWSTDVAIGPAGPALDGEVEDYAVIVGEAGARLSGTVFLDTGAGGGTAHDGLRDPGEMAGPYGTVEIVETAGSTPVAFAVVNPDGTWSAALPSGFMAEIALRLTPAPGHLTVSENAGTAPVAGDPDPADGGFVFVPAADTSYAGLDFGLVPEPSLTPGRVADIAPGQVVDLPHRYEATTTGTVVFALANAQQSPAGGFATALFRDADCDGMADAALSGPVSVVAGQSVCLVARTQAGSGIGDGARLSYDVTADTSLSGTALVHALRSGDVVGGGGVQELILSKRVTNLTAGTPEGTVNSGVPGDVLAYRLVIVNPGTRPLADIEVFDTVPSYTALSSPVADGVTISPGVVCILDAPGLYVVGYAGGIRWTCPGSFPAGGEALLGFEVRILP